jgi:glycosyltransferase involved in cell wall biosynthesis
MVRKMKPDISIIIPTMKRDTLQRAIDSVYDSVGVNAEVLVRYDPDVNEYVSRVKALHDASADIIGFLDDDALYEPNTLKTVLPYFKDKDFVQGVVKVQGRPFAFYATAPGTACFVRKSIFDKVTYRFDIVGREPRGNSGRGWRADTMLLFDFLKVFGESRYALAEDVIINHPENMKGFFTEDIERKFYYEYADYCDKYIVPIDPRLQMYLKKWKQGV